MSLFTNQYGEPRWGSIGCAGLLLLIAGPASCGLYSTWSNSTAAVTSAPGRVISKTLETNNIIQNYESFFDRNANYTARMNQIKEQSAYLKAETDPAEKVRLRTELSAMRMSCREIAASYNADSEKQNRSIFKSRGLPPVLSVEDCDA